MPNIQEAKYFEFTVQILPPPRFISVYALVQGQDTHENLHLFMSPLINGVKQLQERNDILLIIQGMKCYRCFGQIFHKFGFLMILGMKIKNVIKKCKHFLRTLTTKVRKVKFCLKKIKL